MAVAPIALGIDLGTSNSACAVVQDGRAKVVRRGEDRIIPSVVAAQDDGSLLVGQEAKHYRAVDPRRVVFSAKRLIGRRFASPEVQRMAGSVPYRIVEGPSESVMVDLGPDRLSVVEISSQVLSYLRQMAEEALGQRVKKAVIAVPANFTDSQRSATRLAAKLAGLDVLRVINEPTAAALAYGYIEDTDRRIAVYDFGGGTFDVTILQITRNVFEVLATAGEMFLGGDDLDAAVLELMVAQFERQHGVTVRENPNALERLRAVAEQVKIELSGTDKASIRVEEVLPNRPRDSDLEFTLSVQDLRRAVQPIVQRTVPVCEEALSLAGLATHQIDEIVLVGGTTRMPLVREVVEGFFGKSPRTSINPMSVVAVGSAIQAAALMGSVVPLADGTAATPGAGNAVLLDVTPRSLGLRTVGGYTDVIIARNSTIPLEQTRMFTTTADDQRFVKIQICQGEHELFDLNTKLGEITLTNLRSAPRGALSIAVTFEINADGLLEVRAADQETGSEQAATMRVLGGLPDAEVKAILARRNQATSDAGAISSQ